MKDETSATMNMQQSRRQDPEQYDEIDLREYVAVAIKRKNIVLAVFGGAVLIAAVWSFAAPKIYEISTLIGPAAAPKVYEVSALSGPSLMTALDSGTQEELDSVGNMKALIESGAFDEKIVNELGIVEGVLKLDISQPKDSRIMKVSLNRVADKTDLGKKTLTALIGALNRNYAKFLEDKRNRIENQIKMIRSGIVRKEDEMKLKIGQSKILADKEQQCIDDLKGAKVNSDKFLAVQAHLSERNENKDAGTTLLYVTTIQQNISYLSQLKAELSAARTQKETLLNGIDNLKSDINADLIGIENMKLSEDAMHNIVVIQEPFVSPRPIGPKRLRNILLAAVAGVIAGLSAALVVDWWETQPA